MRYLVDTHIVVWRLMEPRRLPKASRALFLNERHEFLVPTIALLEIQYLIEVGRIQSDIDHILAALHEEPSFQLIPYDDVVMLHSLRLTTTRDPFDRIILAHALATSTPILTKDRWMRRMAPHLVIS